MNKTSIEWCDYTWNPISGCSPASEGCANCYAEGIAKRFKMPWGKPVFHPERLSDPLKLRKPSRIFVCSMSDLFHERVQAEWINGIIQTIRICPQHTFIILTKRSHRMKEYISFVNQYAIISNLWLGVTVEKQARADERIPLLLQTPAAVRFVSVEPMLGEVNLQRILVKKSVTKAPDITFDTLKGWHGGAEEDRTKLDWGICGPESGPKARPFNLDWARSLRDQCAAAGAPFFFKGIRNPEGKDYLLDGVKHFEWPEVKP